jgi:hypothetical protein
MINILNTENSLLVKIFGTRWAESQTLWDQVEKSYKNNLRIWKNDPEWLSQVAQGRSKTRDNRVFLATESQLNKLTARPAKPMVSPANITDEAKLIATDLQSLLLESYRQRHVKKHMKRGLRYLHMAKLMCLKVFWNIEIDDYDVKVVDPRKVRFSKNATNEEESEFAIEKIDDKKLMDLLTLFPKSKDAIMKKVGLTDEQAVVNNPAVEYFEVWIGDGVFWTFRGEVLDKIKNPYYDFEGLLLTPDETARLRQTEQLTNGTEVPAMNGRRRRQVFSKFKEEQETRNAEADTPEGASKYEAYLYNHFDKPRKPYIFGTIFEVGDQPVGETTLIEQVAPLQENLDKRKRQIADNSDMVNGITKVDTDIVTMTLADARRMHYDPEGLIYGPGVSTGVSREVGQSLPEMVFLDMQDSRKEIDEIFGTVATFRGTSDRAESATGRAILREEGLSRLDEVIDLIDFMGRELYAWWFQMIKVKYTESHLTKPLGSDRAGDVIDIMQDDLQDGIEIQIQPGQTLPDDKVFRAERAREDAKDGLIDPITYLENAGGYDNPEKIAKRAIMFKANPFSVLALDGDDLEKLMQAQQVMAQIQGGGTPSAGEGGNQNAQQVAQLRERVQTLVQSDEFKALPKEKQEETLATLRGQLQKLGAVESPQV